ncbi:MAG: hypothetical protein JO182_18715, partial [Acidobacteriaceae bacterium]|nr:hypothetical protein [Acidobacteriaceae bacterium]
ALRSFRRSPGFVLTVAGTIALGLGLNTALFTAFNAYVLRPLSIHDPYSLYRFTWTNRAGQEHAFSWPEYQDLEKSHHAFSEVAAVESLYTRLDGRPVQGQFVTGNYFQMLGVGAAVGLYFRKMRRCLAAIPSLFSAMRFGATSLEASRILSAGRSRYAVTRCKLSASHDKDFRAWECRRKKTSGSRSRWPAACKKDPTCSEPSIRSNSWSLAE